MFSKSGPSKSSAVDGGYCIDSVDVGLVFVDTRTVVVAAKHNHGFLNRHTVERSLISVGEGRVCGERTASVIVLIGNLLHLFSHEIVSFVADAAVGVPVVAGVRRALDADSADPDISKFAETANLVPVLVFPAHWGNKHYAALGCGIINFVQFALSAGRVDPVVSENTDAGLSLN